MGWARRGDVAGHLEGNRRLARAWRTADEQELARLQPATDGAVDRRQPERNWLVLRELAGKDPLVDVDQDVERGARNQRAALGVEAPGRWTCRLAGLSAAARPAPPRPPGPPRRPGTFAGVPGAAPR